jgi:hypothetical protein
MPIRGRSILTSKSARRPRRHNRRWRAAERAGLKAMGSGDLQMDWNGCSGFWHCVYDFQNLASGVFAVLAAGLGAWALFKVARKQARADEAIRLEQDRRRLYSGCRAISAELKRMAELARQAEGTIRATIAASASIGNETRERTKLPVPLMLEDWEFLALLPVELTEQTFSTMAVVKQHNFDMQRAGGSYGDTNFGITVGRRASQLMTSLSQLSNEYLHEARKAQQSSG